MFWSNIIGIPIFKFELCGDNLKHRESRRQTIAESDIVQKVCNEYCLLSLSSALWYIALKFTLKPYLWNAVIKEVGFSNIGPSGMLRSPCLMDFRYSRVIRACPIALALR